MKLTKPQQSGLEYFKALADGQRPHRMGMKLPADRVLARLVDAGLLVVVGYRYGPVHAITAAGRSLVVRS